MEEWRDIPGYEGAYQISSEGRVRSLDRIVERKDGSRQLRKGRNLSPHKNKDGYMTVKLTRRNTVRVHTLVARAFLPNPEGLTEVNHRDFDRSNNHVENLEWIDHPSNVRYSIEAGRHYCTRDLRGSNNPNYGNTTLKNFYKNNPEAAKRLGRHGEGNGRAVHVRFIDLRDGREMEFGWIRGCVSYLESTGRIPKKKNTPDIIASHIKSGDPYFDLIFSAV